MDDKELDKLFREKLGSYSEPSEDIWPLIEASLEKSAVVPLRRAKFRRTIMTIAAAAAVAAIGFILWVPDGSRSGSLSVEEHALAENPVLSVPSSGERTEENIGIADTGTEKTGYAGSVKKTENPATEKTSGSVTKKDASVERLSDQASESTVSEDKKETITATGSDNARPDKPTEGLSDKKENNLPERTEEKSAGKQNYERYFLGDGYFAENSGSKKGKYLLAVSSNLASGMDKAVQGTSIMNMLSSGNLPDFTSGKVPSVERISDVKYSMPLNVGVQVQLKIDSHLAIGLGIRYSFLQSKYDGLINKKFNRVKQSLHYIGIPVNLYAIILDRKNFMVYANAGGSLEKGLRAEYSFQSYDGSTHASSSISGVSYSVNAGLGVEYRFVPLLGVYLQPDIVYYFNSKIPASIRTDQPFQAGAEIGFRFHF